MDKFNYTYSAPSEKERKEIESIRRQYEAKPSDTHGKLAKLRKLNSKVNNTSTIVALILGIIGTLFFGFGLTLVLEWGKINIGIAVMIAAVPIIAIAYPIYKVIYNASKKKYAPEIIALSNELLNENQ